ncbi:RNA 2'-phosphotransferase [Clostridium drakei]|uniref:RNA 2'-phosphotransferase n=1 Tax=Clostridium drakei TaxID=332101 RepID=UPI00050992A7
MSIINYTQLSKEISYALRHAPWEYELELDEEGWVSVEQLLIALKENKKSLHNKISNLPKQKDR